MNRNRNNSRKAQAALDFMVSYGIFIIIIAVALVVIYSISTSTHQGFSQQCVTSSGFSCGSMFLFFNGLMNISIVQATGGDINVYGIACSSSINTTTTQELPRYGNVQTTNAIQFYPSGQSPGTGVKMFTGTSKSFSLYCYGPNGLASFVSGGPGSYVGYIWMTYSLPGTATRTTQLIAALNAQYV